jgi:ribosomal 30S subunit maturation factor RimM
VVERVQEYPASQVLCVRADDGLREVPMREPYLVAVELEQGRVLIEHWDELTIEK